MKYFAVLLPMLNEEKSQLYRPQHLEFLESMNKEGKIFARGRFADGSGGMVIYIAETLDEAKSFAEKDPYIIHEARGMEIHEWEIISDAVMNCSKVE
ncbi:YciI family protein [Bacillus sp. JJ1503]|uniref:YciI family protein n=1 Tax=unclassified Bacillus (in: firmicutes) TaxID=185979 RepID=UPI00300059C6